MAKDTEPGPDGIMPANDNQRPDGERDEPDRQTQQRVDRVVLAIARLIGRQMAREDFERLHAANDNKPHSADDAQDGADED